MTTERRRTFRLVSFAALATMLAACSHADPPGPDDNLFPAGYRQEIISLMPKMLADPSGIRNASVSEPALTPVGSVSRYTACVRYTGKKSATEYAAPEEHVAVFFAGQISQFLPASSEQCGKAVYGPFPELEKICFKAKCT